MTTKTVELPADGWTDAGQIDQYAISQTMQKQKWTKIIFFSKSGQISILGNLVKQSLSLQYLLINISDQDQS